MGNGHWRIGVVGREATCRQLGEASPCTYQPGYSFSNFWRTYTNGLGTETQQGVGKETGETAHQERWYHTLRQCLGRSMRQTLPFSKLDF